MLLDGGCLPQRVPAYEFHEIYHPAAIKFERNFIFESGVAASTDDTLPRTPFSQLYTVRRRCIVIHHHIPLEYPYHCHQMAVLSRHLCRRGFRGSLRYSPPTPPVMSWLLATHHRVHQYCSIRGGLRKTPHCQTWPVPVCATQPATTPLSPRQMTAYAKKWQCSFLIISYYDHQTTLNVCYQT
ncbi:hypothetical protein FGIG_05979 [Fasciola gigantica]|uniref:Uncharacterized protein n=1 Tax=Fasciola gigantica TaxID=46835 RepID=A0A504YK39_FASGI|nr:hypothetical protein FGIG_05979 [Fasciola gigantica]